MMNSLRRMAVRLGFAATACLPVIANTEEYPAGEHSIAATIETGNVTGGRIAGVGSSEMVRQRFRGAVTELAWTGGAGPLVLVNGQDLVLEHVSLNGATWDSHQAKAPKADIGVLLHRTGPGIATGRVFAEDLAVNYCRTGLQFATESKEYQCAESDWRSVSIGDCDVGVRIVSEQALGHYFSMLRLFRTPVGVQIEGGGKLLVDGMFTAYPATMVKFAPTDKTAIGPNAGRFEFRNVFLDRQAEETKLLEMSPSARYYASIYFNGGIISYRKYTREAFTVCNQTSLTIRDFINLQPGMIEWDAAKGTPRVLVDNCCLWGCKKGEELFNLADSRGAVRVTVRDCYGAEGEAIDNWSATLQGAAGGGR